MNEVIDLIKQKILDIQDYPITTQEDEQMHILEIGCLRHLLSVAYELSEKNTWHKPEYMRYYIHT